MHMLHINHINHVLSTNLQFGVSVMREQDGGERKRHVFVLVWRRNTNVFDMQVPDAMFSVWKKRRCPWLESRGFSGVLQGELSRKDEETIGSTGTISKRFSGNQGNVYHYAKRRERMNSIGSHRLLTWDYYKPNQVKQKTHPPSS